MHASLYAWSIYLSEADGCLVSLRPLSSSALHCFLLCSLCSKVFITGGVQDCPEGFFPHLVVPILRVCFPQLIIGLYLFDSGDTSWLILFEIGLGIGQSVPWHTDRHSLFLSRF